jgi:aminoglycoside phosphotransferase (APT) family kinase protein
MDQPGEIRKGEELDVGQLASYLESLWPGEVGGELAVRQFQAGFSNLTYWVKWGEREMVLRRPPFGASAKGGHDMGREYRVQRQLQGFFDKVPEVYAYCEDLGVLGAPFYLMERVKGDIVRKSRNKPAPEAAPERYQALAKGWLDTLIELHQVDYQRAGLGELGRPQGYNQRQVHGWAKRYENAKTGEVPEIEQVIKWLQQHIPEESATTLIHNDYKYDNIVVAPDDWGQVRAVLDWEMTTLGDPIMDLGTSLAYWVNPEDPPFEQSFSSLPTFLPGNPKRSEVVGRYFQKSSLPERDFLFYYVYGLFKVTVIAQQIFFRYKKGFTKDPRFSKLDEMAKFCCQKGLRSLQKKRLDDLF